MSNHRPRIRAWDSLRFDQFWEDLRRKEKNYRFLSLDPKRRFWIDTYPPLTVFEAAQENRGRQDTDTVMSRISANCKDDLFSLYFHIGFCRRRCSYCRQYEVNIVKEISNSDFVHEYIDMIIKDIDTSLRVFPYLKTRTCGLYFGGGTPSILPPNLLASLLEHLLERFELSFLTGSSTFEISPEGLRGDILHLLKALGVPRISLGIQSFDNEILDSVGRNYTSEDILHTLDCVSKSGFKTINVDIINGFPRHKDFEIWKQEIKSLEGLFFSGAIDSVTIYMLHYFPGTNLRPHVDDSYWQIRNLCYARECLLGRVGLHEGPIYWFRKKKPEIDDLFSPSISVFGYGNSSFSQIGRWLLQNEIRLSDYMSHDRRSMQARALPVRYIYRLTDRQKLIRSLLFGFRFGSFRITEPEHEKLSENIKNTLNRFVRDGLLKRKNDEYLLTDSGKVFAHQLPYYFFDREIRNKFMEFLDHRFS